MILTSLSLSHFRNIPECHLSFSPGVHVFYGDNAQGKTNLLESIYVCATSRSHRATRDRELIDFEKEEAHIKMTAERRDGPLRIDMHLRSGKSKGVAINGIPIRKVSELFGNINVIFFRRKIFPSSKVLRQREESSWIWSSASLIRFIPVRFQAITGLLCRETNY